jgi:DNA repair protein RecO (recombination protein O)
MADRAALAALNAIGALLVTLLPEREPNRPVYDRTVELADALAAGEWDWPARYASWELGLLTALGFGLDLGVCGATGVTEELVYVSPRSGRAVSREAGGAWADKLLPLPGFLIGRGAVGIGAVREALRLTGFFLEHRACPALAHDALPEARGRLLRLLESHQMVAPGKPHPRRVRT